MRALRHRDFRLLWLGALFSFMGSQIQITGQQWFVFELTHDEARLGLVAFCASAPVVVLGPIAGALVDKFDRRRLLILCQFMLSLGALILGTATLMGVARYELVLLIASMAGISGSFEIPARQSIIGRVVPTEDLPSAIPLQAMTFNVARIFGPVVGGFILGAFAGSANPYMGPAICYLLNGVSYAGLIFAATGIKADLSPNTNNSQDIRDLLMEGLRFTFRDVRLRTLFVMESAVSAFGLFYLSLMAAIAKEMLGMDARGLGLSLTMIGIGALCGLLFVANKGNSQVRGWIVRIAMVVFGFSIIGLGFATTVWVALPLMSLLGMSAIMQFNTTNTLFQMIAPDHLRGRVIAMHVWALSGIGPFGTLFFSWLASEIGIPIALRIAGICVLVAAAWGWSQKKAFRNLP